MPNDFLLWQSEFLKKFWNESIFWAFIHPSIFTQISCLKECFIATIHKGERVSRVQGVLFIEQPVKYIAIVRSS